MSRLLLLGVPLDPVTSAQAIERLRSMLGSGQQHHVMTPNSEMLVEASYNQKFHTLLSSTSLNLPDSAGLLWMARWTGRRLPERVTGVDTVIRFCRELSSGSPVFLLGGAPGIAEEAAAALQKMNPQIQIVGAYAGSPSSEDAQGIIGRIQAASPHVLFVAYGAPAQDFWIAEHLTKLPSVRIAMGVGGTFDFLAARRRRAPLFFQKLGLEWLWRLLLEPSRWRRMWRAVVVFPWLVVSYGKEKPGEKR